MKVVFATGIFPPDIGGPATSVSALAEAWSARGHRVTVVTYADSVEDGARSAYGVVRVPRALPAWKRYAAFFRALWRASDEPGPIFAQDAIASGVPALLVAWLRRRRFIVRIAGDFAWEQAHVKYGYGESLETFQKDARVPLVPMVLRAVQRFVYRRADLALAPSRYLAAVLRDWGVPERRIRMVYNGVHLPEVAGERGKHPRRIVAAGRLVPWKNFDVLIKAMPRVVERFPDAELLIAGDGPELTRLRALASAPMLAERVTFAGKMEREALWKTIAESGVFALVSSYEGFSHQLVEASACGTAIVASRAGGNTELIENGRNGLLVEPGDAASLAQALIRFLEDPAFARACAEEAAKDARTFSIERQIAETSEIVLGAPGLRVVLVSRDGTVADAASRTAARMRSYGERVDHLRVVSLAKQDAASVELSPRVHADVVDVRGYPLPWRLVRQVREAIAAEQATLVVAQDPFEAGLVGAAAASAEQVPFVVEEHGGVYLSEHWRQETLKHKVLYPLGLRVLKRAAGIRAVSVKIEEDLRRRFPTAEIVKIPVYTEPRTCRSSAPPHVFGYVGRFVPQKNLFGMLEAFAVVARALPQAKLLLVGAGPLENTLKARAFVLGISERVEWIAHTESVDSVYERIGTLVLSSWYEGWARVVPEAMSCGIPVVMTDVGCANELLRNGMEGYVVPIGDDAVLAKAMIDIVQSGKHGLLAAAAKRRVETSPTPQELGDRLVDFWKRFGAA
ncbi:MAG: glycosyltransferase [Patescibacteria group bacterium]|nr:MAG: glycosyltransferase [Patescibacteria group bacterium]